MNQWEMMRGNNAQKLRFDAYMAARRNRMRPEWFNIYPASTELDIKGYGGPNEPPLVCDVGGNTGYDVARFLENNPHIKARCVVEDLPETLANGLKLPQGIDAVPYNFFEQSQPVKGKSKPKFAVPARVLSSKIQSKLLTNFLRRSCLFL